MASTNPSPSGLQFTSPVSVAGSFDYNGGPPTSAIPASGGTVTLASGVGSLSGMSITPASIILFTLKTASGTINGLPYLTAINAAADTATIAAGGSDNSTYNYIILG